MFKEGDIIYKYTLIHPIGSGCYGSVWLAFDNFISKDVAIKILDSNEYLNEYINESNIGNQSDHVNLVKIHYADYVDFNKQKLYIIAMDFHQRGSVSQLVNFKNFIPIPIVLKIIIDVLKGLEYLHTNNIFHNDIKPNNILISDDDNYLLTDFGVSRRIQNRAPTTAPIYTLHIAPESIHSYEIGQQSDIYQIGITLFRLLNGIKCLKDKFNSIGNENYLDLVKNGKLIEEKDYQLFIPPRLKRIIRKATHIDKKKRYLNPLQFRRDLEKLNFKTYWDYDEKNDFVGYSKNCQYSFSIECTSNKRFNFAAYKFFTKTERLIKISKYSRNNLSSFELKTLQKKFMINVINDCL